MILIGREHLTAYIGHSPSAKTALAMWRAIAQKASWRDQTEVASYFPTVKFLTPKMACFYPAGVGCVVTTQIAFNSGILIVLAVTVADAVKRQES